MEGRQTLPADYSAAEQAVKLQARINDEELGIEIVRDRDQVTAKVGDREYQLEVTHPEPNILSLRDNGKVTEVFVSPAEGHTKATVNGHEFEFELIDPKRLRGSGADAAHAGGAAEIKTAMPGKVVRILLEAGAEVRKGEPVLVIEAMKMQNEMKSPKDGVIKELRATEGSTVNAGDVLVVIE
jgi:biotin carboxyl carrier protein